MKKFIYSLLAVAMTAFVLSACLTKKTEVAAKDEKSSVDKGQFDNATGFSTVLVKSLSVEKNTQIAGIDVALKFKIAKDVLLRFSNHTGDIDVTTVPENVSYQVETMDNQTIESIYKELSLVKITEDESTELLADIGEVGDQRGMILKLTNSTTGKVLWQKNQEVAMR